MADIQVLDEQTIDQIAAGEVVERPSSVVKELVENAVDAGATAITIEIKDGGISFIRITDNGQGIPKAQVPTAFLRHATSKLKSIEDLLTISSLGFRGEALSSIAAVAQVELITKTSGELTGTKYVIEGSKEKSMEDIGAPDGTTFLVRNLFYNTPARQKFLKSAQTEASYISSMVERLALSHPDISFQFIVNNQPRLHTNGNTQVRDIIYHIFGRELAAGVLKLHAEHELLSVSGYIGKPFISRGNRNFETYFINGRYIKSALITKCIEDAYKPYLMKHQYPFTVLQITIDSGLIDVNVHPAKMEIRFRQGEEIYKILTAAVKNALEHKDLIPQVPPKDKTKEERKHEKDEEKKAAANQRRPEPFEKNRLQAIAESVRKDSPYERKYELVPQAVLRKPDAQNQQLQTMHTGQIEQSGGTGQVQQPGSTGQVQQLENTGEAEQLGSTAQVQQLENTGQAQQPESTEQLQPLESMGEALQPESTGQAKQLESIGQPENTREADQPENTGQTQRFENTGRPQQLENIQTGRQLQQPENMHAGEPYIRQTAQDIRDLSVFDCPQRLKDASGSPKMQQETSAHTMYASKNENISQNYEQLSIAEAGTYHADFMQEAKRRNYTIIGQLFDTYWLVQVENELFIIDQHAAHEKVLYEKMMAQLSEQEFTSQQISPPVIVTMTMTEQELFQKYKEQFERIGFEVSSFGGREYSICAVPANLYSLNQKDLFMEMLDGLSHDTGRGTPELILEKIASMSCKAAVKGSQRLSRAEVEELLKDLLELENPYNCPHGRPTIISMTKSEIERKFKRIV